MRRRLALSIRRVVLDITSDRMEESREFYVGFLGSELGSCPYICVEGLRKESKRGKLLEKQTHAASPGREVRSSPHGRLWRFSPTDAR
jgi:hypothetical protein